MLRKFSVEIAIRWGEMGVTAGSVEFADLNIASQEGPHLVRLRKAGLRRRINGQLMLRYEAGGLTSFASLELVGRFLRSLDFRVTLRRVERALPRSDFGAVRLSMLVAGARRVRHVCYLANDPLVERLCGLSRLPSWHTLGRFLRGFYAGGVMASLEVNERLVAQVIKHSGLPRLTLDVDSSVVSTGLRVEGARRSFNLHRRKVPSYYPITAYEANTGQVLRVHNRAGNVHDGKASVVFLGALFEQLGATLERRPVLEMRMDGAFFHAGGDRRAGRRGRRIRDQGTVLALAGTQGADRQMPPALGARGQDHGVFRSMALGAAVVTRDACRGVPQACAPPDGKELSTRPLRSGRWLLRVLGHRHQQGGYRTGAMVLYVWEGHPREGLR